MSRLTWDSEVAPGTPGIYRIYSKCPNGDEVTLYVGRSKDLPDRYRGYAGAPKVCRTKDATKLDTRMIVHALIDFIAHKDGRLTCHFEHLSWDDSHAEENHWVNQLRPTLQRLEGAAAHVSPQYYLRERTPTYWKEPGRSAEARQRLFRLFENEQWPLIQALCPFFRAMGA